MSVALVFSSSMSRLKNWQPVGTSTVKTHRVEVVRQSKHYQPPLDDEQIEL